MFTIKYIDQFSQIEMLYGDVVNTSFNACVLTAQCANGQAVQFGPNYNPQSTPRAFVMNEAGSTVAVYDFHHIDEPKIDPDAVELLGGEPAKPNRKARRAAASKAPA